MDNGKDRAGGSSMGALCIGFTLVKIKNCFFKTFMPKQQWLNEVDKYHCYMLFILHFNVILIYYIVCKLFFNYIIIVRHAYQVLEYGHI